MAAIYGTIAGLYGHGLPRGSLVSRARLIASVDPATDVLELEGHGLPADMPVTLTVDAGGELPSGLSTLTVYYAKLVELESGIFSESLLQLAATAGGAAIDLTDEGAPPFRLHVSGVYAAQWKLEVRSRWVDGLAIAHAVPFEVPYPVEVVELTERAAALDMLLALGNIGLDSHTAAMAGLAMDASRILKGLPIRDEDATGSANSATGASPTATSSGDTWRSDGWPSGDTIP